MSKQNMCVFKKFINSVVSKQGSAPGLNRSRQTLTAWRREDLLPTPLCFLNIQGPINKAPHIYLGLDL